MSALDAMGEDLAQAWAERDAAQAALSTMGRKYETAARERDALAERVRVLEEAAPLLRNAMVKAERDRDDALAREYAKSRRIDRLTDALLRSADLGPADDSPTAGSVAAIARAALARPEPRAMEGTMREPDRDGWAHNPHSIRCGDGWQIWEKGDARIYVSLVGAHLVSVDEVWVTPHADATWDDAVVAAENFARPEPRE